MFKVIIAGSRGYTNYSEAKPILDSLFKNRIDIEIVSGKCSGADLIGELYAIYRGLPVKKFPADWAKHGNAAGPIRNEQMAQYADALVLFWDGKSKGSSNMLWNARKYGLIIRQKII